MRKSLSLSLIAFSLLIIVSFMVASSFDVTRASSPRNANSSTTTNRSQNQNDSRSIAPGAQQQDFSKNTWELPEDADKTKNPVPSSAESIEKGKALYLDPTKGNCIFCHGE